MAARIAGLLAAPARGERMRFESEMPDDLQALRESLGEPEYPEGVVSGDTAFHVSVPCVWTEGSEHTTRVIIESDTGTRREKMLHGRNLAACLICKRRSELDFSDLIRAGMNVARILKIGAAKADSSIGVSGLDDHARACTGMHTNPCADYR